MSIDRLFDDYLAQRDLTRSAEVIPEECQIFEAPLEDAVKLVRSELGLQAEQQ